MRSLLFITFELIEMNFYPLTCAITTLVPSAVFRRLRVKLTFILQAYNPTLHYPSSDTLIFSLFLFLHLSMKLK